MVEDRQDVSALGQFFDLRILGGDLPAQEFHFPFKTLDLAIFCLDLSRQVGTGCRCRYRRTGHDWLGDRCHDLSRRVAMRRTRKFLDLGDVACDRGGGDQLLSPNVVSCVSVALHPR
jgi:hypothetical protein